MYLQRKALALFLMVSLIISNVFSVSIIYASSNGSDSIKESKIQNTSKKLILSVGSSKFILNNNEKDLDPSREVYPVIINNRVMVPLRAIVETLGGTINWFNDERKVVAELDKKSITIWDGKSNILVGDELKQMDVNPQIVKGRLLIPLRSTLEALGCSIGWDSELKKVSIEYINKNTDQHNSQLPPQDSSTGSNTPNPVKTPEAVFQTPALISNIEQSASPTISPILIPTPVVTTSPIISPIQTPKAENTTPTYVSNSPNVTPTGLVNASPLVTPKPTPSPKVTPNPIVTPSPKVIPSPIMTPSPKVTPSPIVTPSPKPTPSPTASTVPVPKDYISYWNLDENSGTKALDLAPDKRFGSVNGAKWVSAYLGNGLSFDGINNYVTALHGLGDNFTISFWLKTSQTGTSGVWSNGSGLIQTNDGGSPNNYGTALIGNKFGFGFNNPNITITSTRQVNDNLWHHCVATRDKATGEIKIYVDGKIEDKAVSTTQSISVSSNLIFGSTYSKSNFFNGTLDDIRLYGRVLSDLEVSALANMSNKNFTPQPTSPPNYNPIKTTANKTDLKVTYLDVDDGDSILIQTPENKTMLIDAGNYSENSNIVRDHLQKLGINKIDILIATHPHVDHIGGMAEIIDKFEIGKFYTPNVEYNTSFNRKITESLTKKGLVRNDIRIGTKLELDTKLILQVLGPINSKYDNLNDYSAVIKLTYNKASFLFTADATEFAEKVMIANDDTLANKDILKSDVIKLGHHGSAYSSSQEFINAVMPKFGIISAGTTNTAGHPHVRAVNRVKAVGGKVFRTDQLGIITVESDGIGYDIYTENRSNF